MTNEERKSLDNFETKVRHLMYIYSEQKRNNIKLKQMLEEQEKEFSDLKEKYNQLQKTYSNLKIARTINLGSKDVNDTKKRVSTLVREIDKCIALLNE